MENKKFKNYENEIMDKTTHIVLLFFTFLMFTILYVTYSDYKNGHLDNQLFLIIVIIAIFFLIMFIIYGISNYISTLKKQELAFEITQNGKRVSGKIIDTPIVINYNHQKSSYYYAIVEYEYDKKIQRIETPRLNFSPIYLLDNSVDVYIYNNNCYVDNYKINYEKQNENKNHQIKTNKIVIISFLIMALLLAYIVYLSIINVLTEQEVFAYFIIIGFSYFIIVTIISIKRFFK